MDILISVLLDSQKTLEPVPPRTLVEVVHSTPFGLTRVYVTSRAGHSHPPRSFFAGELKSEVEVNCQNGLTNCASVLYDYGLNNQE